MADDLSVGDLSGNVTLNDQFSDKLDAITEKLNALSDANSKGSESVGVFAESMILGEAAVEAFEKAIDLATESIKELVIEGSKAADVADTFERMSGSAQAAEDTLDALQEGTKGLVGNFDLMKSANQEMALGLQLTAEQQDTLAQGAVALAKATGTDVADALEKESSALATGRTRGIAMLTGKIDLKAAEESFAESLGTTTDHLTEQGKQQAIQETILERISDATDRVGEAQLTLGDRVKESETAVANFVEELGIAVATNPVLIAGYDALTDAFKTAFGDDQASMIKTIMSYVETFAIDLVGAAEYGVKLGGVLYDAFQFGKIGVDILMDGVDGLYLILLEAAKGAYTLEQALGFGDATAQITELNQRIDATEASIVQRGESMKEDVANIQAWDDKQQGVIDTLEGVKQTMIDAQAAEKEEDAATKDSTAAHNDATLAAAAHSSAQKDLNLTVDQTAKEVAAMNKAWDDALAKTTDYHESIKDIPQDLQNQILGFINMGVSVNDLIKMFPQLSDAEVQGMKLQSDAINTEVKAIASLDSAWTQYYQKKGDLGKSDLEKVGENAEAEYEAQVKKAQDEGIEDEDYYNSLEDLREKNTDLEKASFVESDANSKANLEARAQQAQDYYDMVSQNSDQYTQTDIANAKARADALRGEVNNWGQVADAIQGAADKVTLLDGEVVSLAAAEAKMAAGGATTYDLSTSAGLAYFKQQNAAATFGQGWTDAQIMKFIQGGGTLQQLEQMGVINLYGKYEQGQAAAPPPSFAEGGVGDFGSGTLAMLHGQEAVIPLDKAGAIGGVNITFYVNGTGADVANTVKQQLTSQLQTLRQF